MSISMKTLICIALLFFRYVEHVSGRGTWNKSGKYEYYASVSVLRSSYKKGQKFCQCHDGQLALIKSEEVQRFVETLVMDGSGMPYGFFIGLRDRLGNKTFVWDDGENLSYQNWGTSEPNNNNEFCVVVGDPYTYKDNLEWNNVKCGGEGTRLGHICQRLTGKHWNGWSQWNNCSCLMSQSRERICKNTMRSGPNSCNQTTQTEIRNCTTEELCATTSETTKLKTSYMTTIEYKEIPDAQYALIGSVAGSVIVLLIVITIVLFCCLKKKSNNKSKDLNGNAENKNTGNALSHVENGLKEGEYSTILGKTEVPESEYCKLKLDGLKAGYTAAAQSMKKSQKSSVEESTDGYCTVDLVVSKSIRRTEVRVAIQQPLHDSPFQQVITGIEERSENSTEDTSEIATSSAPTEAIFGGSYATAIVKKSGKHTNLKKTEQ